MKFTVIALALIAMFSSTAHSKPCVDSAKQIKPVLSDETKAQYKMELERDKHEFEHNPDTLTNIIWFGRRTAYLGEYKAAIKIYTDGLKWQPRDPRIYRHRGHRYITLRCFDDAIKDLEKAAKLIKGKPDEIELDGLPNARNIPTSTLQSNIWYHLGLAYYLNRDFTNALRAYNEAEKVSKNPDMLVATKHWQYMTLRRLGRKIDARRLLAKLPKRIEVIENDDYLKLIKLYRGEMKAEDLLKEISGEANTLGNASLGYGLGNWYLYNGSREEAVKIFKRITSGNQWASFGFIAAEVELKR